MQFARRLRLSGFALVTMLVVGSSAAQAQTCGAYGTGGFPVPGWLGWGHSPYSLGQIPTPPYFAIHPPVYYSSPVPRTYGYSPYAYPGTMQTPEVVMPEVIENPHVQKKLESTLPQNVKVKTVRAAVIDNPFVRPELKEALTHRLANHSNQ